MKVVCAVLAAGASRRMGTPKQRISLGSQTLLGHVVELCCASRCSATAVVLGAHAEQVAPLYAHTGALTLHNPRWPDGLATSMHAAVRWAQRESADGLLLCTSDQPLLSLAHLDALCTEFLRAGRSVASVYDGLRGVPALLHASHFGPALRVEGDRGAGAILRADAEVVEVPWPDGAVDLDTPEDVLAFRARS